jgi:protein-tyrosine-phosphatase
MAGAFAQTHGEGRITSYTGGTHAADNVHPIVVEAMKEKGIDISENKPRKITADELHEADTIVVMGCGGGSFCPAPLLDRVIDWDLEDPADQPIEKVREIRDEIERRVLDLIETLTDVKK